MDLESGGEYRSAKALQMIIMVLAFFLNKVRNNSLHCEGFVQKGVVS